VLVIVIIAVASGGNSKTNTTTSSSQSSKTVSSKSPQAPQYAPYPYTSLLDTDNGAFITINGTVTASESNRTDLPALCKYFSEEAAASPKEYYAANLFDDPSITQDTIKTVVNGNASDAQNNQYDQHYVLNYNYNPTTHNNVCNIMYGGDQDNNASDNQSISY
jgi:hypothetical protein